MTQAPFLNALLLTGGDWVIYGLILCSVLALAVIIERWIIIRREEKSFAALRRDILKGTGQEVSALEKTVARHHGASGRILKTALSQARHGPAGFEDMLIASGLQERGVLEKHLLVLGTLGNNAPFIGLFGTVLGVIRAFHDLSMSGAGPEAVMEGLSMALVATAVGLFVAIPAVVSYNYFQKKVQDILSGTESLGRLILARVRQDGRSA